MAARWAAVKAGRVPVPARVDAFNNLQASMGNQSRAAPAALVRRYKNHPVRSVWAQHIVIIN